MSTERVLRRLGLGGQRVVIIHADDAGMCAATVAAVREVLDFGLVTSASAMVPCPAFGALAAELGGASHDLGVHLTLTSEWPAYRWGPVSRAGPDSGLLDEAGYFFSTCEQLWQSAQPQAVMDELLAQVSAARAAGLEPSHLDMHMMGLLNPRLLPVYADLARAFRLPVFMWRRDEAGWRARGHSPALAAAAARTARALEADGFPLFERFLMLPLDSPAGREEQARRLLEQTVPGLNLLCVHPARPEPDLSQIIPDWEARVADWRAFTSEALRSFLQRSDVRLISYRALAAAMD